MPVESRHDEAAVPERIRAHLEQAALMFEQRFGRVPTLASCAPGRVNLIGEHTDYNQGFVLPVAIERQTSIVADIARGRASTFVAADLNDEMEADLSSPLQPCRGVPGNYLLGMADQFQRTGLTPPNLDVLVTSSVPIGAGLSSSAAVEVAFAIMLARLLHTPLTPLELARLCQRAEHAFPGTPCGIMDMYVSAAAREHHALLIDCRSDSVQFVPADFASLGASLLIVDTGIKHDLASSAYTHRRETCEMVAKTLGQQSLRHASVESLNVHGLSDDQRRKALHVIAENTRTVLAAEALALGNLARFGELMFHSHASLRDLFEVSCDELDVIVNASQAMHNRGRGVFGARMTGGGFGGCAIVLCEQDREARVIAELTRAFEARFGHVPARVFATAAAGGARAMAWPA